MIAAALALMIGDPQPAIQPAQPAQPPPAPAAPTQIVLPAGTPVRLVTTGEISSRSVRQGERFALQVADDVTVGLRVLVPRGTPAIGEVEALSGKGMFGKAAKLDLQPLFIEFNGQRLYLVGSTETKGHAATTAAAITSVLTPLGLAITGKSAVVPAGSVLYARIRSDVTLAQN